MLRLGTRGSKLALIQANWVKAQLEQLNPDTEVQLHIIITSGDRQQYQVVGAFTNEIQTALLNNEIDMAVHSMKDLPTQPVKGLKIAAVPLREDPRDALISPLGGLKELPHGAIIGAGSARRAALIHAVRPDITTQKLTGNVDTRLRKLREGQYQGIVMAMAAQNRMGWWTEGNTTLAGLQVQPWPTDVFLPAPAQAALALECRSSDIGARTALSALDHPPTHSAVIAERAVLHQLGGGCSAPVGAYASVTADELTLTAIVASQSGSDIIKMQAQGLCANARKLGITLAKKMLKQGADVILREVRNSDES
ncbi:MAG: hydroxymethylbilane synthase [Armatimonadota bacterium]